MGTSRATITITCDDQADDSDNVHVACDGVEGTASYSLAQEIVRQLVLGPAPNDQDIH